MLARTLVPLLVLAAFTSHARAEALFDAKSTFAVVTGVLEWKDRGLSPFSKEKRKDQELFDKLAALGVPAAQRTLLLDEAASASAIEAALTQAVARAPAGSTLLFYYAGHGLKDDEGHIVFASSEIRVGQLDRTGLHLARLPKLLSGFKGRRVILLADCCYSGGLIAVAAELSRRGLQALALTSAEAANLSTSNWTYTQTLIDALAGRALLDRDDSGTLTLGELAAEVEEGMRYREAQRSGFAAHDLPETLTVARAIPEKERLDPGHGDYERRDWVTVSHDGKPRVARIIGGSDPRHKAAPRLFIELFDYATRTQTWVDRARAEPLTLRTWPVGSLLRVRWGPNVYDAKVLRVDDGFMYITYPGWDARWDEWITAARVVAEGGEPAAERVKVEWNGRWYDATVKGKDGNKWCISYVGYGPEWDECVGRKRIRFGSD